MHRSLFRFFASLKLAVVVILSLSGVLAYATVSESFYGMRGAHLLIYGTWWFSGLLFLLGLNVFCAAAIRYPWKAKQTGFVVTHAGILIILVGSFMTQKWGVDGNLPVTEGTRSNTVLMPEMVLTVRDEAEGVQAEIPVPESTRRREGELLTLNMGNGEKVVVKEFLPRLVPEKRIIASPVAGVGTPALQLEIFNSRFRFSEWLKADHPSQASEWNLGPATLSLRKLWTAEEEREFLSGPEKKRKAGPFMMVRYQGRDYRVSVDEALKKWQRVGSAQIELQVERYLPYAVVEQNELVSRSNEPVNPAVQILVRRIGEKSPGETEKHTLFALYPEFNTQHRKQMPTRPIGAKFQLVMPSMQGGGRGKLEFYLSADNRTLHFRSYGANGERKAEGKAQPGQEIGTGWMDLKFKIVQFFPQAIEEMAPRYVDKLEGGGESNFPSGIRVVRTGERYPAKLGEAGHWLVEGAGEPINAGNETWTMQYGRRLLRLPFDIFLEKFTVGTDPGTNKAASYESDVHVTVADAAATPSIKISMNEPMRYGGYTFYQASYQMEEGKKPVSVFSVNYDPGRGVKYLGSIVMVLGILLMFYANPHYWGKMTGRSHETP